jgi:hypothetical protein
MRTYLDRKLMGCLALGGPSWPFRRAILKKI